MFGQVLPDYTDFTSRDPEPGFRALARDLRDVLQMPKALKVARIVPTEKIALALPDHEHHCVDPQRMAKGRKARFLRALDVFEHVPTLERIAVGTYGPFKFDQNRSHGAVLSWYSVRVSRHLGRLAELAGYSFSFLQRAERHRYTICLVELKLNLMLGCSSLCALSTITALAHNGETGAIDTMCCIV